MNITNVTINQTEIRNYRNVGARNAVTVVSNTSFISGRKELVRVKENPFREANARSGQPAITPTRQTSMPVIRNIPASRKPPERVKRVSVDEIKRERAVVREEKGSVFTPGRPGAEMPVRKRDEPQQNKIRAQQPALPAVNTSKKEQLSPRIAPQPQARPDSNRERPAQPTAKPAPPPPQTLTAPDRAPARQPELNRERPAPPTARPAPQPQQSPQPQSAVPGTLSRPQTRAESPGKAQREPRWQEPTPSGGPAVQPKVSPQQPTTRHQPSPGRDEKESGSVPRPRD